MNMNRKSARFLPLFALILALAVASGCRKGSKGMGEIAPPDTSSTDRSGGGLDGDSIGEPAGTRGTPGERVRVPEELMRTVYFDFDRSNIRADQIDAMEGNAEYLVKNPGIRIRVEGHCDERGTLEYNMALGQRRANQVRDFLLSRGVAEESLRAISQGEEMPAVEGTGEAVWTKNRRGEFYYVR
jgi:peptidoglycan-associated lipoprotein